MSKLKDGASLDGRVFWPSIAVILGVTIPLIVFPEAGNAVINQMFAFATGKFGWLYLVSGLMTVVFLLWMAFGRYGNIRLGRKSDVPEFSYFSWVAMIFCGGIGIAIVNWAWVEPIYYFNAPPLNVAAHSREAAEWALTYGQFHWGLTPWAFYCLPALPIAYSMYVRRQPGVRLSVAARGVLGDKSNGWMGITLDTVVVFGIVGGVGTSLGLAVPLVSTLASDIFGIQQSFLFDMCVLALWTLMFGMSVWFGLSKGIKILSDINVYLAFALLLFAAVVGPTLLLINGWANSLGLMVNNFIHMSLWTDPVAKGTFPQDWTIFYWAWWIAYAPMMGLFVARISRGRTIKELILAELVWGSLGCWVFFAVWGGYSLNLQLTGELDVSAILSAQGIPAAVLAILKTMPFSSLVIGAFVLLCFVFLATTLDSAAYVLASVTSNELSGYEEPQRWLRIVWALSLAVIGIGLLKVGGLKAVQTSTIVVALPLIPVLGVLTWSLLRMIRADLKHELGSREIVLEDALALGNTPEIDARPAGEVDFCATYPESRR
ncbi:BCCT family transporter [Pseudomonas asiatica]|uniref:BCCT family transporter n=1 Tax=Pseudomonas asiatica TaxID=2219225 RepID=UPI002AC934B9|nr:BCCT family transporter [Pseudomonas asiatica]WPX88193.1 L-carnitine/gamma-butyrobetaine antiporter [Pseudomonas asiatica]